jgi:cell division protease FtsH
VAGEAGVPFFSISGSEFVEMFVGVGASRVRDMFEQAKKNAPCIVFIDEIDAVGRQRGAGLGGGNDEREQTLNQLLTEMDGFEGNTGIIIVAATNRPDVLDQALLRPGRFDRQVVVDRPDYAGRLQILEVHARGKTLAKDVDLDKVARRTPGFTGADLANLLNEAAILAARRQLTEISMDEVNDAIERVMAGPEKKDRVMSEKRKRLVAYHEAGHALVGALMPDYDPVQKISIIPRGQAGGLTFFTPSEERMESGLYSRSYLQNQMAVALGGRVAEEIVYGEDEVTTGASNDLQQVARVARQMITRFGMSDRLGPVALGRAQGGMFLGRDIAAERDFSEDTAAAIDEEVSQLVAEAYRRATEVLTTNRPVLDRLADLLVEQETVDAEELQELLIESDVKVAAYV